jgi:hypothetical protein
MGALRPVRELEPVGGFTVTQVDPHTGWVAGRNLGQRQQRKAENESGR